MTMRNDMKSYKQDMSKIRPDKVSATGFVGHKEINPSSREAIDSAELWEVTLLKAGISGIGYGAEKDEAFVDAVSDFYLQQSNAEQHRREIGAQLFVLVEIR